METGLIKVLSALEPNQQEWEDEGIESKDLHMNYAQLLAYTVRAQSCTAVVGRGGGKSDGILAPRVHDNVSEMPRSSGVALGTTYIQLLDRTLPALFNGFQRLGYVRDKDYWVRRFPDKSANLLLPYHCPLSAEHSIFVRNANTAAVCRLVSQDRPGTSNGLSVDWLLGDEVKYLNEQKLNEETRPINRGGIERYGHTASHHGEWFTTDMPTTADAKWIFNAEKEAEKPFNQEAVRLILAIQLEVWKEKAKLKTSPRNKARLSRIVSYENQLNELRKGLTHFIEASAFVNVHVLGLQYFKQMFRTLPPLSFQSSILNKRKLGVENGFYSDLDPLKHYYDAVDYAYVDSLDFGKRALNDCRKDADIDHSQPITIGMDYGAWFNCLWAGQRCSKFHIKNLSGYDEVKYLKCFFAPHPAKVGDVVKQFTEYYRYYYRKEVTFVYDHTAVGKDGKDVYSYADLVIKALKEAGWKVKAKYIGQTKGHNYRYNAWAIALKETDDRIARQRFNRENTRVGFEAMTQAGTKQGKNGFEKDKKDEQDRKVDQSTTTHLTDAVDTLFWWLTFEGAGQTALLPATFGN